LRDNGGHADGESDKTHELLAGSRKGECVCVCVTGVRGENKQKKGTSFWAR